MTPPPSSTYRLQVNGSFDLDAAAAQVDYLARLGIGAVYTSPLLAAAPGSTHGYDVVDPTRVNPELGGEPARQRLVAAVRAAGLGLVVDIVPNHMSVAVPAANPWWWDVLESGRDSPYAKYFDIDWDSGPVLLPILADDDAEPGVDLPPNKGHYRTVSWRRGNGELNYRRFFDITTLAAVRVEEPDVFAATHGTVLGWVATGEVTGLRVDHPDGLAGPGAYLRRLRAAAPDVWLVVEKILGPDETLPAAWPVDGTTGYDVLRLVCGVFVDPAGEAGHTELAGDADLPAMAREAKRWIAEHVLLAEVRRIARLGVPDVSEKDIVDTLSRFEVYRSYLADGEAAALPPGRVARHMLADPHGELTSRVEQTAAMVMAKGVEDTVFYRYNRFVALNEVGGDPGRFGVAVAEFHDRMAHLPPATMTTLSTHDTKRSEDVRARLAVLAEIPGEWAAAVRRWSAAHPLPEPTLNLLAWQSLVGAWPISAERLSAYLDKAAKEAKLRTSWTDHDEEFEAAVRAWPAAVLADESLGVAGFVERIRPPGWSNSLGQKLVQLAGPGVPDVYQGTELLDLSLVDPDNRRPVDFAERARLLDRLERGWLPDVADQAAKLHVVRTVLRLRRDRPELFAGYRPLRAAGPAAGHVLAFERFGVVAVATRLPVGLARAGGWRDTELDLPGSWIDLLTRRPAATRLSDLFASYPVALLLRDMP